MKTPHKLIVPEIIKNKWWEKYPKLNSSLFTYENSGRYLRFPDPYFLNNNDELVPIPHVTNKYDVLGYTLNPPFQDNRDDTWIAIMFENRETFEKIWFHYL